MAKELPFDDDVMTLIMGLGGPEEPGHHGRENVPMPTGDTVSLVTKIRDMCDDWLKKAGKGSDNEKPKPSGDDENVADDKSDDDEKE